MSAYTTALTEGTQNHTQNAPYAMLILVFGPVYAYLFDCKSASVTMHQPSNGLLFPLLHKDINPPSIYTCCSLCMDGFNQGYSYGCLPFIIHMSAQKYPTKKVFPILSKLTHLFSYPVLLYLYHFALSEVLY